MTTTESRGRIGKCALCKKEIRNGQSFYELTYCDISVAKVHSACAQPQRKHVDFVECK